MPRQQGHSPYQRVCRKRLWFLHASICPVHRKRRRPTQRASFLQDLIDAWEAAAQKAETHGNAVTLLRTGVVLDLREGALPEMMKPFQMFVGGPVGTGEQMMSWISIEDVARIIAFLLEHTELTGAVNCTSPGQQTICEGAWPRDPSAKLCPDAGSFIRAIMGQMGDELIVSGQHVYPERLLAAGFRFTHSTIEDYLGEAFSDGRRPQ